MSNLITMAASERFSGIGLLGWMLIPGPPTATTSATANALLLPIGATRYSCVSVRDWIGLDWIWGWNGLPLLLLLICSEVGLLFVRVYPAGWLGQLALPGIIRAKVLTLCALYQLQGSILWTDSRILAWFVPNFRTGEPSVSNILLLQQQQHLLLLLLLSSCVWDSLRPQRMRCKGRQWMGLQGVNRFYLLPPIWFGLVWSAWVWWDVVDIAGPL